jgi:hypothetical protein
MVVSAVRVSLGALIGRSPRNRSAATPAVRKPERRHLSVGTRASAARASIARGPANRAPALSLPRSSGCAGLTRPRGTSPRLSIPSRSGPAATDRPVCVAWWKPSGYQQRRGVRGVRSWQEITHRRHGRDGDRGGAHDFVDGCQDGATPRSTRPPGLHLCTTTRAY